VRAAEADEPLSRTHRSGAVVAHIPHDCSAANRLDDGLGCFAPCSKYGAVAGLLLVMVQYRSRVRLRAIEPLHKADDLRDHASEAVIRRAPSRLTDISFTGQLQGL